MNHRSLAGVLAPLALATCSCRQLAINALADALASGADVFASEEDPELARDALPFALKSIEAVLAAAPEQEKLLLAACSGFTQYAYAFVEADARRIEDADYEAALALEARALRLYLRARDYGLRGLELRQPGISAELRPAPYAAAERLDENDVALAYWTGAAWGLAISVALDRPDIAADIDAARALLRRALALDEAWNAGAIHEALITIEALPEAMGGSRERARAHFQRAVELSGGRRVGPYVVLAESVSIPSQNRVEFEGLLGQALQVDLDAEPAARLANHLARDRARHLLEIADELFLEPLE